MTDIQDKMDKMIKAHIEQSTVDFIKMFTASFGHEPRNLGKPYDIVADFPEKFYPATDDKVRANRKLYEKHYGARDW